MFRFPTDRNGRSARAPACHAAAGFSGSPEPDDPGLSAVVDGGSGWEARIELGFERRHGRTVMARRHYGPLAVQKPFYPEGEVCHTYLLHPPGGIVGGDRLTIEATVRDGARALLTTPAAAKIYRSARDPSVQEYQLKIAAGGALEWLPQETILFAHCQALTTTRVEVERGAAFIGWEILCLGRPASDERFDAGSCRQRIEVWREGTPLLIERARLEGGSSLLSAHWGLMGRTVVGTLVALPANHALLETAREAVVPAPGDLFSATLLGEVLVCRYLGGQGEAARRCFTSAWSAIRPHLLVRPACYPRIWST
ncbi:MAG: Urease accessory protein UreD [Chromatiales bacterium USCg_Taylor]|nr:MAG: Urease accessory protein UreD [Chromatiales bacterium USCg_Taylor]